MGLNRLLDWRLNWRYNGRISGSILIKGTLGWVVYYGEKREERLYTIWRFLIEYIKLDFRSVSCVLLLIDINSPKLCPSFGRGPQGRGGRVGEGGLYTRLHINCVC